MTQEKCYAEATLAVLPPELLAQIVVHVDTVRTILHLALTCRNVYAFVENDGFRVFVQTRFPYIKPPARAEASFWKEAALGITSLAKNWDRRAFVASILNPQEISQDVRSQRLHGRPAQTGQTMGFTPVIDSYEAWYAGGWTSRKEVVSWGAGAALCLRSKIMGNNKRDGRQTLDNSNLKGINAHGQSYAYATYNEQGAREGLDDITSVNLLPQQSLDGTEQVMVGRASGGLTLISISTETSQAQVLSSHDTLGRPVRSATTRLESKPLLAACLSDSTVALYPIDPTSSQVYPISQVLADPSSQSRIWSSRFLSHDRLLVGLGPAQEPLHIYNVGRGEISQESVHKLDFSDFSEHAMDLVGDNGARSPTSVYSLAPIDPSSLAGRAEGSVFLSGAYDGLISLHDLRSAKSITTVFRDPVDTFSPVYSLLSIGTERFVAGGARHSVIKVFDLRMPGGKLYHAADLESCSGTPQTRPNDFKSGYSVACSNRNTGSKYKCRNWNVFVRPTDTIRRRPRESPVYALSRPSQCSPTFFAGVESTVIQFDMVSIMDKYVDPVFKQGVAKTGNQHHLKHKWNPQDDVLCLPMYEHTNGPVRLLEQRKVGYIEGSVEGLDERWRVKDSWPVEARPRQPRLLI